MRHWGISPYSINVGTRFSQKWFVVQKLLPLIECRSHIDLLPETVFDIAQNYVNKSSLAVDTE
jgi:hypothetical protein